MSSTENINENLNANEPNIDEVVNADEVNENNETDTLQNSSETTPEAEPQEEAVKKEIKEEVAEKEPKQESAKAESETKKENTSKKPAKKAKKQEEGESLNFKCEQFFGKNWKYVASFLGIAILVGAYELNSISGRMEKLEKIVLENNEKVVLTTSDGRAIKVTKEPLKAEYLKQFVVSTYVNNFIVSRSQLTNNFEKSQFKDYGEVMDNVPQIRNILTNFMDYQNDPDNDVVVNQIAVGDLRAYVQWLIGATAQDKLPEYIAIKDYSVEKYEYTGNKYSIEIVIKVVAQSYILSENSYKQQNGNFKIISEGSFDLTKSSDINPYGMRIENLKIEPVTKIKVGG